MYTGYSILNRQHLIKLSLIFPPHMQLIFEFSQTVVKLSGEPQDCPRLFRTAPNDLHTSQPLVKDVGMHSWQVITPVCESYTLHHSIFHLYSLYRVYILFKNNTKVQTPAHTLSRSPSQTNGQLRWLRKLQNHSGIDIFITEQGVLLGVRSAWYTEHHGASYVTIS